MQSAKAGKLPLVTFTSPNCAGAIRKSGKLLCKPMIRDDSLGAIGKSGEAPVSRKPAVA